MDKFLRFQIRPSQLLERMLGRPVNFLRTSICPNLIATGWAQVWWPRTNVRESQISTPSGKFCLSMLKPSDTPSPIITGPRGPLKILQILEPLPLLREAGKQLLRMILTNSEMMAEEGEWDTLCPITGMSMLDCHPLWSHFSVTAAFAAQSLLTLLAEVQLTSFTGRPCRWWGGTGKCLRDGDACVHSVIFDVCVIVTSHPCVCAVRLLLTLLVESQQISLTDRLCCWQRGTGKYLHDGGACVQPLSDTRCVCRRDIPSLCACSSAAPHVAGRNPVDLTHGSPLPLAGRNG